MSQQAIKQLQRQNDERWIQISEVHMASHTIVGLGIHGEVMQIQLDIHSPLVAIPQVGEVWSVQRKRQAWYLDKRQEKGDESTALTTLAPGDRRIEAGGTLYINVDDLRVNSSTLILAPATIPVGSLLRYDGQSWESVDLFEILPAASIGIPGRIFEYAGDSVPDGFVFCDGAFYDGNDPLYERLWDAIGNTYGGVDQSAFAVPDKRQRFGMGVAAAGTGSVLGETGGDIDHVHGQPAHTHTGPSHTHSVPSHTHTGTTDETSSNETLSPGAVPATDGHHTHSFTTNSGGGGTSGSGGTGTTSSSGNDATDEANPPYIALNYIIEL